tara:strand:- start:3067 stop:4044 length:978 start_codon:yes stop_codon:yes gene_type:complete
MSEDEKKEEWNEVVPEETTEEKVEYEVEGEQKEEAPPPKEEVVAESPTEETPPELEGVQTKGAQKRIRQLVKQRKERDEQLAQVIRQNEQLSQQLNQVHQQFTSARGVNLDASEKQLTDKLELARNAYKAAHEEGDSQKVLQAQEMLNDAQTDLKAVQITKQQFQQQQPQENQQGIGQQQPQYQPQPTPDPKAQDWASQNEWFGNDRVMTAAALAIDAELKEEGFSPTDPEFYQEVDNRIKRTFPHKFSTTNEEVRQQEKTSPPAQVVAGASRSSPGSNKKVKLSKEDIRLANKWNVPLEKYAEEKLKADKAEGEYTTINMQRGG